MTRNRGQLRKQSNKLAWSICRTAANAIQSFPPLVNRILSGISGQLSIKISLLPIVELLPVIQWRITRAKVVSQTKTDCLSAVIWTPLGKDNWSSKIRTLPVSKSKRTNLYPNEEILSKIRSILFDLPQEFDRSRTDI